MKKILFLLCCFLTAQFSFAQSADVLYKKGDSLYKAKDYKNAAMAYSAGIKMQGKGIDENNYWRAASRFALANIPDSAFYFLNLLSKSANISQGDVSGLEADKDLNSVKTDKRWKPVMDKLMTKATSNYKLEDVIYGRKDGVALTMLHIKPRTKANGKTILCEETT